MAKALIWGVTGQSGSYLAEELLRRDYDVIGIRRRTATGSLWRLDNVINNPKFKLISGDITDAGSIYSTIINNQPDVIYNAAAQSHVHESFNQPLSTWDITGKGHLTLLEAIRNINKNIQCVFFSSSETFGSNYSMMREYDQYEIIQSFDYNQVKFEDLWSSNMCGGREYALQRVAEEIKLGINPEFRPEPFQYEETTFNPRSPYAIAKLAAFNATKLYREAYGMKCFSGILFNKESPRRGINFVTRKITSYFYGLDFFGSKHPQGKLKLGNIESFRDWSYSPDVMRGLVDLAESSLNNDYVLCTGETHSIKEFLDEVGEYSGLDWKEYVEIDQSLFRPAEVPYLRGNADKIKNDLGWSPKVKFKELVKIMCENENGLS